MGEVLGLGLSHYPPLMLRFPVLLAAENRASSAQDWVGGRRSTKPAAQSYPRHRAAINAKLLEAAG